ncbi:MAG: hypothetical protein NTZ33_00105 [Bacteroidetes bacterium]|nr:hypothetical protein [Bacteroidota bacterium]
MKKFSTIFTAILIVSITISSCKKDSTTTPTPTPAATPPAAPMPTLGSNITGALIAVKTQSKVVTIPGFPATILNIGTAVAVFPGATAGTYVDAGNVSCNTLALTKQTTNLYLYTPGTANPTGIDYSTGVPSWNVSGSTNITAFTASANSFPSDVDITSSTTVNTADAYSLTATAITGADSLIFAIHGPSKSLIVTRGASLSSYTFTAADLATVGKGAGFIQVSALRYKPITNSSKTYWLINQNVATIAATIQ